MALSEPWISCHHHEHSSPRLTRQSPRLGVSSLTTCWSHLSRSPQKSCLPLRARGARTPTWPWHSSAQNSAGVSSQSPWDTEWPETSLPKGQGGAPQAGGSPAAHQLHSPLSMRSGSICRTFAAAETHSLPSLSPARLQFCDVGWFPCKDGGG